MLANIVLNELDHWVESQWIENPVARKYSVGINPKNGAEILSSGYNAMRRTKLKEMHIVRYADDFRIFCRSQKDAQNTMIAVMNSTLRTRLLSPGLCVTQRKTAAAIESAKKRR